ncbi:MAG: hypothetical protein VX263_01770 [Bacteroidota bacterium]|nr:hypothetical protein [Bacteroidota bacterium]
MKKNAIKTSDIDLHGMVHSDIDDILENHCYLNIPPFKIITGNSNKMKKKVMNFLDKNDFKYMSGDIYNQGYINVL